MTKTRRFSSFHLMKHDPPKQIKLAVFDVDRTILRNTSGEIQLLWFLIKHHMLPLTNGLRFIFYMMKNLFNGLKESILQNKLYLHGVECGSMQSMLPEFYSKYLQSRISPYATQKIKNLKAQGYTVLLLSGTLDFIVQLLVDNLQVSEGIGSRMEVINGQYTGQLVGIHPFYKAKVEILKLWIDGRDVDYSASYAFGDSWADVPLLSCFGHPIALNPGLTLTWQAKARGWQIVRDK